MLLIPCPCSLLWPKSLQGPQSRVDQRYELSIEEQSYPFYLRLYPLYIFTGTFCKQLVDVVDKLKTKYDIVPDKEMNSHAIDASFFNGELSDYFGIMILEVQNDTAFRSFRAYQFDFYDLHFCWLIFFQRLFFDVSQQSLFISLERLVILILDEGYLTRWSISAKLTLKFSTLTVVLVGS